MNVIPEAQQDGGLRQRLVNQHGPAILAWLVRGARNWSSAGLGSATVVDIATKEYRVAEDLIATFLDECTVEVDAERTKVGDLFKQWGYWCKQISARPGRVQDFRAALEDHDLTIEPFRNVHFVLGRAFIDQRHQGQELDFRELHEGW
jgi:putative DNA primase/helicase